MEYRLQQVAESVYTNRLLREALQLSNFKYKIPKDPEQRMFDFYFISLLGPITKDAAKIIGHANEKKNLEKIGGTKKGERAPAPPPPVDLQTQIEDRMRGYSGLTPGSTRRGLLSQEAIDDLIAVTDDVATQLFQHMKEDLLDATYFSIASEFRHVLDMNQFNDILNFMQQTNNTKEFIHYFKDYQYASKLDSAKHVAADKLPDNDPLKPFAIRAKLYTDPTQKKKVQVASDIVTQDPIMKRVVDDAEDFFKGSKEYICSYVAAKSSWKDDYQFIDCAEQAFVKLKWRGSYGGPAWQKIGKGWKKLYEATFPYDQMVWIDHLFDLEHNTGTMLNKVKRFQKGSGWGWLKTALDFKYKSKRPMVEFMTKMSPQMQWLGKIIRFALTGVTDEDIAKNKHLQDAIAKQEVDTTISAVSDVQSQLSTDPSAAIIYPTIASLPQPYSILAGNSKQQTTPSGYQLGQIYKTISGHPVLVVYISTAGRIYGVFANKEVKQQTIPGLAMKLYTCYKWDTTGELTSVCSVPTGAAFTSYSNATYNLAKSTSKITTLSTSPVSAVHKVTPSPTPTPVSPPISSAGKTVSTPSATQPSGGIKTLFPATTYTKEPIKSTGVAGVGGVFSMVINIYNTVWDKGRKNFSGYFKLKKGNVGVLYYDKSIITNPTGISVVNNKGKTKTIHPIPHTFKACVRSLNFIQNGSEVTIANGLIANAIIKERVVLAGNIHLMRCVLDGCTIDVEKIPYIKLTDCTIKNVEYKPSGLPVPPTSEWGTKAAKI